MYEKIVVAIDESEHAGPVLTAAAELATKFGSELRIVHVVETAFASKLGSVKLENSDEAHKIVNDAVANLDAKGVKAAGEVRVGVHGKLAVVINDEAHSVGATLIILGSRGLTDLEGLMVGSTTHRLLHLTDLPVLIIP
jgi:nucleotide-binding universal stress UspA family protein